MNRRSLLRVGVSIVVFSIAAVAASAQQQYSYAPSISFVDPVPSLLVPDPRVPGLLDVTSDPALLATGGKSVAGAAGDGVSELVVKISGLPPNEWITINLLNESGVLSIGGDGGISSTGYRSYENTLNAQAQAIGNDNVVFVTYSAPPDFVRSYVASDMNVASRNLAIQVLPYYYPGDTQFRPLSQKLLLVRPPVLFVHGLWSNPSTWNEFDFALKQAVTGLKTYRADYSSTNGDGLNENASNVGASLISSLDDFEQENNVVAAQFDVVAHSMGGLIAFLIPADLPSLFYSTKTFHAGYVHKLVTIDTPYQGSLFAAQVEMSSSVCQEIFSNENLKVGGAIADLAPGGLHTYIDPANPPFPVHAIAGVANTLQTEAAETTIDLLSTISLILPNANTYTTEYTACASIFTTTQTAPPQFSFSSYFEGPQIPFDEGDPYNGANDLIVSESSQNLLYLLSTFSQVTTGVVHFHVAIPGLDLISFTGSLDAASGNPEIIKTLLNAPVSSNLFLSN